MPKVFDLPPPPDKPEVSPPVVVRGESGIRLTGLEGQPSLEALVRVPADASRAVILCHPHPLYGGTMHSAVILAVAKVLGEREDIAHLRFNYRGVGASEGRYDEGRGEVLDVRAAIADMRTRLPKATLTLCGYSFGSWVGLRAAAIEGGFTRVALVAPAVRIFDFVKADAHEYQGRLQIFIGDRDEFCDVAEAEALARDLGSGLEVFENADHYFLKARRKVAERVVAYLGSAEAPSA